MAEVTKTSLVYLRQIPVDVKDQFKAWCARHHVSMSAKMVDMMRECVAKEVSLEKVRRRTPGP